MDQQAFAPRPRNAPQQAEWREQQHMQQRPPQASQHEPQRMQRPYVDQALQHELQHMQRPHADQDLQQQPQRKAYQHDLQQRQRTHSDQVSQPQVFQLNPKSSSRQVEQPKQQHAPPRQNAEKDNGCVVSFSEGTAQSATSPVFTRSLDFLPNVSLVAEEDTGNSEAYLNEDKFYDCSEDNGLAVFRGSLCWTVKPPGYNQDMRLLSSRSLDSLIRPEELHGELLTELNSHIERLDQ